MDVFRELGDEVGRRWERCNYEEDRFPAIATECMAGSGALESVSLEAFAGWFVGAGERPAQKARSFGQPPINVYNGRGFYLELLFWVDTPTTIHQHAFSGAFGVLRGSSFHSTYTFEHEERISREMLLGRLNFKQAEFLQRGDVRTIEAGDRFIHALLHLDSPSISLVVRTYRQSAYIPQYRYLAPGMAIDPSYAPEPMQTQLKLLRTLAGTQPELFRSLAERIVRERDLWFAFKVVELAALRDVTSETYASLLTALTARHPALGRILAKALREELRQGMVQAQMRSVRSYDHRFLFALLLNAPNRTVIDDLIRARYPDVEPETRLVEWIEQLASDGRIGLEIDETSIALLQQAMRGQTFTNAAKMLDERVCGDPQLLSAARKTWYRIHSAELLQPLVLQTARN